MYLSRLVLLGALGWLTACGPAPIDVDPQRASQPVTLQSGLPAVGSREYKVMLDPAPFGWDPQWAADTFWDDLSAAIRADLDRPVSGDLDEKATTRTVRFLDTPDTCRLSRGGFVLRERQPSDGETERTLKYRSPDRYLSVYKDLQPDHGDADVKFEEDISAPFQSRFSHSATVAWDHDLETLDDLLDDFEGVARYFRDQDRDEALAVVGGQSYLERRFGDATVDLGRLDAAVRVTVWWADPEAPPVVAEASFRVEDRHEEYSEKVAYNGARLFEILRRLDEWVAPDARTKTRTVYDRDPTFCDW